MNVETTYIVVLHSLVVRFIVLLILITTDTFTTKVLKSVQIGIAISVQMGTAEKCADRNREKVCR